MIFIRLFIADKFPNWDPSTIWYLAGVELLIESFIVSLVIGLAIFVRG